jgi:hypothetical protein
MLRAVWSTRCCSENERKEIDAKKFENNLPGSPRESVGKRGDPTPDKMKNEWAVLNLSELHGAFENDHTTCCGLSRIEHHVRIAWRKRQTTIKPLWLASRRDIG